MSGSALRRSYAVGERALEVELRLERGRLVGTMEEGAEALRVDVGVRRLDDLRVELQRPEATITATVLRAGGVVWVAVGGAIHELEFLEHGRRPGASGLREDFATSPMTGGLVKVSVATGERVARGAELFVVEAMKMEYVVRAPRDVVVARVRHAAGSQVQQGDVVVAFEEDA